jgi:hypothetical protein
MTEQYIEPVHVKLANPEALAPYLANGEAGIAAALKKKRIRATMRTFLITAASPIVAVLQKDPSRLDTYIVAYGNSAVLCESFSQAQDQDNLPASAGTGVFANTPANPQGTLLYVPSGAGFSGGAAPPSPVSTRFTTLTQEVMYATAIAFPTYVAVLSNNEFRE